MKKKPHGNLHWLIGGSIGVTAGLVFSLYFSYNMEVPSFDSYTYLYQICALIIFVSVLLGGAFGTVIGKIIVLLKDIYTLK